MPPETAIVPAERIERAILLLRGHKVLLDSDLADLYGIPTRVLNQAVSRNLARFPGDFMFRLTAPEFTSLRSQIVTSKSARTRGGRRYPPLAFTEQGVAMLSSVLNSPRAVQVNIEIMRAFVRLRRVLDSQEALARKIRTLEKKYDRRFKIVFDTIRALMEPPQAEERKSRIGFKAD